MSPTWDGACPRPPPRERRVLFLPSASGDPAAQIAAFHARHGGRACIPSHLSLFRLHGTRRPLREVVLEQDVVYIGGGSMRNLLAIWRAHGLDALLAQAWERGIVLAGLSAGAMCWFEGGITRSGGPAETIAGLGLLPGSLSVHADGEPERLPAYLDAVRTGALPGGWAVDDGVGLLFEDGAPVRRWGRGGAAGGLADAAAALSPGRRQKRTSTPVSRPRPDSPSSRAQVDRAPQGFAIRQGSVWPSARSSVTLLRLGVRAAFDR